MNIADLGEDAFLDELRRRFPKAGPGVSIGIGDDAAALKVPEGEELLLSTDALVEDVHFTRRSLPPHSLGRKAVAVNLSDIAAMGGQPLAVLLSLNVPRQLDVESLWAIVEGVSERALELGTSLVGGNLALSHGAIAVHVTVAGATRNRRSLKRSGARAGDAIYVSGKIGAAAEGARLLAAGLTLSSSSGLLVPDALKSGPLTAAQTCVQAHMDPQPRVSLGAFLNERRVASSCIDLSDGLSKDLHRLCRANGLGAQLQESALPFHPGLLAWENQFGNDPLDLGVSGGEDYELLFTTRHEKRLENFRKSSDLALTRIGVMTKDPGVTIERRQGVTEPFTERGWDHFLVSPEGAGG